MGAAGGKLLAADQLKSPTDWSSGSGTWVCRALVRLPTATSNLTWRITREPDWAGIYPLATITASPPSAGTQAVQGSRRQRLYWPGLRLWGELSQSPLSLQSVSMAGEAKGGHLK